MLSVLVYWSVPQFLIFKMKINIVSTHRVFVRLKEMNMYKQFRTLPGK